MRRLPQSRSSQRSVSRTSLIIICCAHRVERCISSASTSPAEFFTGEGPRRVAEELDLQAQVRGLPRGGVAAHVGHVPGDRHRVDPPLAQPLFQAGAGEAAREVLLDPVVARPRGHLRVQLPAGGPPLEEGHLRLREGVLDDHDRHAGLGRGVHHPQDVVEVGVRVGDRQLAAREVFVLDVDDQQGSLHDDSRSSVMACRQVEAGFAPHEHGEAAGRFIRPRIGNLRRRSGRIPDGFTRRGRSCPDQRFGAGKRQGPGPPGLPHRRSSAGPEPSRPRPPSTDATLAGK